MLGSRMVRVSSQFLRIWDQVQNVSHHLEDSVQDQLVWRWTSSAAYKAFFFGAGCAKQLWRNDPLGRDGTKYNLQSPQPNMQDSDVVTFFRSN
ncbi:hypothetical protein E2562_027947 [Oryza meyeriana var. granulata]|uniref:Uncharacterized protein n=1 Tax=Oryza meyeriana var. granulata TaxID=110450 RepID=A0A6G1CVE3_9ORYZ|nr:hypothetical protein E2562_027947 [Oryza meyeriana var. granulata]